MIKDERKKKIREMNRTIINFQMEDYANHTIQTYKREEPTPELNRRCHSSTLTRKTSKQITSIKQYALGEPYISKEKIYNQEKIESIKKDISERPFSTFAGKEFCRKTDAKT